MGARPSHAATSGGKFRLKASTMFALSPLLRPPVGIPSVARFVSGSRLDSITNVFVAMSADVSPAESSSGRLISSKWRTYVEAENSQCGVFDNVRSCGCR